MTSRNTSGSWLSATLLTCLLIGCGATGSANTTPGQGGGTQSVGAGGAATGGEQNALGGDTATDTSPGAGGQAPGAGGQAPGAGGSPNPTGGAPSTGGLAATGGKSCVAGEQIGATSSSNYFMMSYSQLAPFYVFNNGWSSTDTNLTTAGRKNSISAFETCTPGTISWKTDYDWTGANNTVKAYPAAILGWQSTKGWKVASQTMLPKPVSSVSSAKCSWSYAVTGGASQNVAYDIWVHSTSCTKDAVGADTAPSDEIMIWLYSNGGVVPAGSQAQSGLSISGASWNLWEGNVSSWKVHSFVRTSNSTTVNDLDIKAFLDKLGLGSKCLTSIQAGTEIFQGSGSVKTNSFTCTVN